MVLSANGRIGPGGLLAKLALAVTDRLFAGRFCSPLADLPGVEAKLTGRGGDTPHSLSESKGFSAVIGALAEVLALCHVLGRRCVRST